MLTSSGTCGTILTCNSFPYFAESGGVAVTSFLSVTSCNARRDIVVGAENPRTGKTVAEKACGHCLQPSAFLRHGVHVVCMLAGVRKFHHR